MFNQGAFFASFAATQFVSQSVKTNLAHQLPLAAMYSLIGRHQWECKLEWVRMRNVPQPIRRLNLRLTANQVMALQVPERPLNSTQRTFLRRS